MPLTVLNECPPDRTGRNLGAGAALPPLGAAEFAARLDPLGPFEPAPALAVAVSGGADSLALALLARDWVAARGGRLVGLIVDHGLRPEAAAEAATTAARLAGLGVPARLLRVDGLARGPGLAARARAARYAALEAGCLGAGSVHLLLGHHAADQAETVLLRALSGSGAAGAAGMAALVETPRLRLLRPLLDVPPGRLRAVLRAAGLGWVEDPSNHDPAATRARLRALRADREGAGPATLALAEAAAAAGRIRAATEAALAALLATCASLHPEGYALLDPAPLPPAALGALISAVAGRAYPPARPGLAALACRPRPATLGGVRLLAAGRLAPGRLLLVREAAAMAPPVAAVPGAWWDRRFRLLRLPAAGAGSGGSALAFGAVGAAAARLRRCSALPAAVLAALPALWRDGMLLAVPHLGYAIEGYGPTRMLFAPVRPACAAPFVPPPQQP